MTTAVHLVNRQGPGGGPTLTYEDRVFIPKAMWSIAAGNDTPDTFIVGAQSGLGWGTDTITQGYIGFRNDDSRAQPGGKDDLRTDIIWGAGAASAFDVAELVSFGTCGETVDWGLNTAGDDIITCAFGGDDLQVASGTFDLPTSGSVTVSGLPFRPKFLAVAHNARATLGGDASSGRHCLGFSDGTHHRSIAIYAPLSLSASIPAKLRDDSISHWDHGTSPFRTPVVFNSNGFTLTPDDYPNVDTVKHIWFACAMDGSVVVGHDSAKTSTGVKTTSTGNIPTLVLLAGAMTTAVNTTTSNLGLTYGILTDRTSPTSVATLKQGTVWMGAVDGAGTSHTKRRYSLDSCLLHADASLNVGAGGVVGEAEGQLTVGGFDLNWTTAATAHQFMYAALEVGEGPTSVCFGWVPKIIRHNTLGRRSA